MLIPVFPLDKLILKPYVLFSEVLSISMNIQKSKEEALWGMFIADALAMPVHWYYNPDDIKDGYGGWLTGYREPEKKHPSSILTLSAVGMILFY